MDAERVDYTPFPKLTATFVKDRLRPGWKELAWAATNRWLDTASIVELADQLAGEDDDLRAAIALADGDADLEALLQSKAETATATDEIVREEWLLIAVAWAYEHRETIGDPWATLEALYCAFDHPKVMDGLIGWTPAHPGEPLGRPAMLERWRALAQSVRTA